MAKVVRASQAELEAAVEALRDGDLVAFPTETVYGLGANASNPAAVQKVFQLKGRPPTTLRKASRSGVGCPSTSMIRRPGSSR